MKVNDDSGVVQFNNRFTHFGSIFNFLLDDSVDTVGRVFKAIKYMGALCFIWYDDNMPLSIKMKLHNAMSLNLLLWGGFDWSVNSANVNESEVFHHKAM